MKVVVAGSALVAVSTLAMGVFASEPISDPDKSDQTPPPVVQPKEDPPPLVIPSVEGNSFDALPAPVNSPFAAPANSTETRETADDRARQLQQEFDQTSLELKTTEPADPSAPATTTGDFQIPAQGEFKIPGVDNPLSTDPPTDPSVEPFGGEFQTDPLNNDPTGGDTNQGKIEPTESTETPAPATTIGADPAGEATDSAVDPLDPTAPIPLTPGVGDPPTGVEPLTDTGEEPIDAPKATEPEVDPTEPEETRPAPAFRIPQSTRAPSRLWMDSSARFTLTASFVSVNDGAVVLRHTDGGDWNISVNQLSRKDQGYIWAYENPEEAQSMRSWSNGQVAKYVREGSTRSRGRATSSSGAATMLSADSLSAYDQGVLEALLGIGK